MSNNIEADLYHTIRNVNDLTKSNIATALMNAVSAGTLALDEYTVKNISSLVNATIDQTSDTMHLQVLNTVNSFKATTRKKPTGRKTAKA